MNKRQKSVLLLSAALALSLSAQAQTPAATGTAAAKSAVPQEFAEGEVRKVDKASKKITLKHGEIKNLGMSPMAMVFEVKDAKVLDTLKTGDKVRFKAVHDAGKYVVVDIQPAK
jgi:Cu(I)/Ag(I) efflux system periplasmic protein CusF